MVEFYNGGRDRLRVYRDGALIATLGADSPPDFEPHNYQVEAYNDYDAAGNYVKDPEGCLY